MKNGYKNLFRVEQSKGAMRCRGLGILRPPGKAQHERKKKSLSSPKTCPRVLARVCAATLLLVFLLTAVSASAVLRIEDERASVRIVDLVRDPSTGEIALDLEIQGTVGTGTPSFTPGSRCSLTQEIPQPVLRTLRVGQVLQVHLEAWIDDLGTGGTTYSLQPSSIVILKDNPTGNPVRERSWQSFFPGLGLRRFLLIAAGVLLFIILRRQRSPDDRQTPQA